MTTEALLTAYRLANRATTLLRDAKRSEHRQRLGEFTKQLDDELATKFDARVAEAGKEEHAARLAYENAIIAEGRATLATMGDLRREEWGYAGQTWERNRPYKPTGRTGILQVRDHDSALPDNVARHSWPDVGSVFIRINRKDGTPGLQFVRHAYDERDWKPIGWKPETDT